MFVSGFLGGEVLTAHAISGCGFTAQGLEVRSSTIIKFSGIYWGYMGNNGKANGENQF